MKSRSPSGIAFLILYYGNWPHYLPLWISSVRANRNIDFLLITDLDVPEDLPENITVIKVPYTEVLSRLSDVIGVKLACASYHKLCDFKPFLGLAFAHHLNAYLYWGYCDLDLFFGDLNPLVEMALREKFDFISPWDCTVGHCTLLRNDNRVNRIALNIPDLKARALTAETTFMDEGAISETALRAGGFAFGVVQNIADEWHKNRCFLGVTLLPDGTLSRRPGRFVVHYQRGRVLVHREDFASNEVLYFHFMGMKARRFWSAYLLEQGQNWNEFSFTPYGIVQGMLPISAMKSPSYRLRCYSAHVPDILYRSARNCIPESLIDGIKRLRVGN